MQHCHYYSKKSKIFVVQYLVTNTCENTKTSREHFKIWKDRCWTNYLRKMACVFDYAIADVKEDITNLSFDFGLREHRLAPVIGDCLFEVPSAFAITQALNIFHKLVPIWPFDRSLFQLLDFLKFSCSCFVDFVITWKEKKEDNKWSIYKEKIEENLSSLFRMPGKKDIV